MISRTCRRFQVRPATYFPRQILPDQSHRCMAEDNASRPNSKQPGLPSPTSKAGEPPHRGLVRHANAGQNRHPDIAPPNRVKIPARRTTEASGDAVVDAGNAWGLDNAIKMVSKHLPRDMRARTLNRYRRLSWLTRVRHCRRLERAVVSFLARIAAA